VEVETKDGHQVNDGCRGDRDARETTLARPKEEVVARTDIAKLSRERMSVMPEGLEQHARRRFPQPDLGTSSTRRRTKRPMTPRCAAN